MSVLAIVPARSGSKSIPGKNLRQLGGKTLIARALDCAMAAGCDAVLSTDIARAVVHTWFGVQVGTGPIVQRGYRARPAELCQDDTPMIDVVKHVLGQVPGPDDQIVVLLQPTQPFRTAAHVTAAIALLQETQADSVVSVVELPLSQSPDVLCRVYDGWLSPHGENGWRTQPTRRQDVEPAYRRDGTVYAFRWATVMHHNTIYGQHVRPLIVPPEESCELDTELDWLHVERRWKERHG